MASFTSLLRDVRRCTICSEHLPLGPRPILQLHPFARILVAGQAPAYCAACAYAMAGAPQVSVVRRMSRGYFKSS